MCTGFQPVSLLTHHLAHYSPLWRFWVMQHYYHHKFGDDPRPVLALLGQKYHKLLDINQNPQVYSAAALNDCLRFMSVFLNSQHGDIWHQTSLQSSVHVEQREYLSSRPVAHNIYKVCVQISRSIVSKIIDYLLFRKAPAHTPFCLSFTVWNIFHQTNWTRINGGANTVHGEAKICPLQENIETYGSSTTTTK